MSETNTHKCIGTIKKKTPKTITGGTTFITVTLAIGDKTELDIEFWREVKDQLDFCPIGSKVEVHSWASTREWTSNKGYVNRTTKLQARSITNLGTPIKSDEPPLPEEQGEEDNIAF